MELVIYSKVGCTQCKLAKKRLESKNIDFIEIDINKDKESLNLIKEKGFSSLPIFKSDDFFTSSLQNVLEKMGMED